MLTRVERLRLLVPITRGHLGSRLLAWEAYRQSVGVEAVLAPLAARS
jgi:hypothetical protein